MDLFIRNITVERFMPICFVTGMLENTEILQWPLLARPYGQAEHALGRLAHALETTPLHATWLWREITRVAVTIAQAGGYQAKVDQLRMTLIGAPVDAHDNTSGLAAAKRIFLTATPLFCTGQSADSKGSLWPAFWEDEAGKDNDRGWETSEGPDVAGEVALRQQGDHQRERLTILAKELAGFADDGRRPALINLLVDLRHHATARRLPPHLLRLALPLALVEAGLVPKPAPGLLGGRRLPLGMSTASPEAKPLSDWLKSALKDLAKEADQSHRRLMELMRQYRAWHASLAAAGLRRHARAPKALDLLASTPVVSIGLVARHAGCSHVAAGKIIERFVGHGILIEQTSRSRHKIFVAGDLPSSSRAEVDLDQALAFSEPVTAVDVDALGATLDGLFADLERLNDRVEKRTRE